MNTPLRDPRVLIALGACALLAVGAVVGLSSRAPDPAKERSRTLATLRESAAAVAYPLAGTQLPPSITISHDDTSHETRMKLAIAPSLGAKGFSLTDPRLTFLSEFEGASRDPAKPELSVRCELSVKTASAGALAPSSPPAEFFADGELIEARPAKKDESGYESDRKGERLKFKLMTTDLVRMANAKELTAHVGAAELRLSPAQIADLREFAARLNPNISPG